MDEERKSRIKDLLEPIPVSEVSWFVKWLMEHWVGTCRELAINALRDSPDPRVQEAVKLARGEVITVKEQRMYRIKTQLIAKVPSSKGASVRCAEFLIIDDATPEAMAQGLAEHLEEQAMILAKRGMKLIQGTISAIEKFDESVGQNWPRIEKGG